MLLFVFWYCHKRGKETRLEKERLAVEEGSDMETSASDIDDSSMVATDGDGDDDEAERLQAILDRPSPAGVPLPSDHRIQNGQSSK